MSSKPLSVSDIARLANVSPSTVSRVINNNGRFSAETEQRVRAVIEKYNYQPNQLARGLRTSRSNAVGIIVPDITNEYFSELILVIQSALFPANIPIVIYNTNESREVERKCLYQLRAQAVSGIVYINGHQDVEEDILENVPTIYMDREPTSGKAKRAVYLSSDNELGGYLAARELIDQGCRSIAVITERRGTYVTQQRLAGFRRACGEFGVEVNESLLFNPDAIRYHAAYNLTKDIIKAGTHFDGLLCQTDWLASGALSALKDSGIAVPGQVKLVGYDDISISSLCQQPFTTVRQSRNNMGKYAAQTLLKMMAGEPVTEDIKLFSVELIRRQTT